MTTRDFDPLRLDVAAFAKAAGELEGHWPLAQLDRLAACAVSVAASASDVGWRARGEARPRRGDAPEVWLHLAARTQIALECQRCLKPVDVPLEVSRRFQFVHGEDAAAQLDTDSEDDVLAISRALDLRELLEDELLLALPIVPRHAVCPEPLVPAADGQRPDDAPNPFAALAALKRSGLN